MMPLANRLPIVGSMPIQVGGGLQVYEPATTTPAPPGANPGVLLTNPSSIFAPTPNAGNPLLAVGAPGYPTNGELRDGCGATDGVTDYWIVTSPGTYNLVNPANPAIELWTSPAGANTWTYYGVVISQGATNTWNGGGVYSPSLPLKVGGAYYMFVTGNNPTQAYWSGPAASIGLYTSTDLIHWTPFAGNPVLVSDQVWEGSQGVYSPSVSIALDGSYSLQYSFSIGVTATWQTALAKSTNLTGWVKQGQASIYTRSNEEPDIFRYNGVYWLLSANNVNGHYEVSVSADDVHWMYLKEILPVRSGWTAGGAGSMGHIINADGSVNVLYNNGGSNARNQMGVANTPAFTMGPSWVADVPGVLAGTNKYSLKFDGTSNYVMVPGGNFAFTSNFSLTGWIKRTSSTGNSYIIAKDSSTDGSALEFAMSWLSSGNGNNVSFAATIGSTLRTVNSSSGFNQTGSWHHIAATVSVSSGNSTITVYFDGASVGTGTFTGTPAIFTSDCVLGASGTALVTFSAEQLCEVHAYSRALSGPEIAAMATGTEPTTNLVSRLRLNEGIGHVAKDAVAFVPFTPATALPTAPTAPQSWWEAANYSSGYTGSIAMDSLGDAGVAYNLLTGSVSTPGYNDPVYTIGVWNGWPVIRFDGSDEFFTLTSALPVPPNMTFMAVLRPNNFTNYQSIIGSNANGGGVSGIDWQIEQATGKINLNLAFTTIIGAANTVLSTTVPSFVAVTIDGAGNGTFWLNGVADGTFVLSGITWHQISNYIGVCMALVATQFFDGDIAAVMTDTVAYSPTQIAAWHARFQAQYGVP